MTENKTNLSAVHYTYAVIYENAKKRANITNMNLLHASLSESEGKVNSTGLAVFFMIGDDSFRRKLLM